MNMNIWQFWRLVAPAHWLMLAATLTITGLMLLAA